MSTAIIRDGSGFARFVDVIIDRIVKFTDYYIVRKYITLSETALFAFCVAWFVWLLIVPSRLGIPDGTLMSGSMWLWLFGIFSTAHFLAFFLQDILYRAVIVSAYAFMWCCVTLLTLYLQSSVPPAPTMFVITIMSLFIAVRLLRERRQGS